MMKSLFIIWIMVFSVSLASANPVNDFLVGIALMGAGSGFEIQRAQAASNKEDAQKNLAVHGDAYAFAYGGYWFYYVESFREFAINGNSASYRNYVNLTNSYAITTNAEAAQVNSYSSTANDEQKKESLYKGVSLTAFSLGSIFIIKSAVTYFMSKNSQSAKLESKYKWVKNFDLVPNRNVDGASIYWTYRL